MGTGRSIFSRCGRMIDAAVAIGGVMPRSVNSFIYVIIRNMPGKIGMAFRYILLRNLLESCGRNVSVHPMVVLIDKRSLSIGDNVSIHPFCYIDSKGGVEIGNNVSVAHGSSIISFDHGYSDSMLPIKYNPLKLSPVKIDNNVWIGCGVRILAGIQIGSRSIVAAGAVVTNSVDSHTIVGGVPAKQIGRIE